MDVWEVPQSSRSGLDRGFLMDVGPKRATQLAVRRLGEDLNREGILVASLGALISAPKRRTKACHPRLTNTR